MRLVLRPGGWLIGLLALGACTVVTDFDPGRLAETTEALCSDGVDNDGDGLTDCQEFGCLDQKACCTLPAVVLVDDFEGLSCSLDGSGERDGTAPECVDAAIWEPWGTPFPTVCEGALVPHKESQCYDVGVLGRSPLPLRSGLQVKVAVEGRPEPAGELVIGLTRQSRPLSSEDECAPLEPVTLAVAVRQIYATDGWQLAATFDQRDVGVSPVVADTGLHEVAIMVRSDRRVHYALDGEEFAASPESLLVPEEEREVRLALMGRGRNARFADALATVEMLCDTPAAWAKAPVFLTLEKAPPGSFAWDAFQVSRPAVIRESRGVIDLFYTGCTGMQGTCSAMRRGIGQATSWQGQPFYKLTTATALLFDDSTLLDTEDFLDAGVLPLDETLRFYVSYGTYISAYDMAPDGLALERPARGPHALDVGRKGSWDDASICCATALRREDGQVLLWYAGRGSGDPTPTWRVGLATSDDGLQFTKDPANPVLTEGGLEEFDGRGISEPAVLYDEARALYRMWYGARALFGRTSIGYAVSADGITWRKYPQNPVLDKEDVGLDDIGSPAVLVEEGQLRMWLHGREPGTSQLYIYEAENLGGEFTALSPDGTGGEP